MQYRRTLHTHTHTHTQLKRCRDFLCKLCLFAVLIFIPIFSFSATLPNGYTQLEFIESTGTQYIDTGIYPDKNTEIEMVVKTNGPGPQPIFGVDNNKMYMLGQTYVDSTLVFDFSTRIKSSVVGYDDFHKIEIKNQSFYIDNTEIGSFSAASNFTQTNTAYLFDTNLNTFASDTGSKIKYLKIWQSGTLVRDYIPAEYNGQVGMYDAVSGNFFTNVDTRYTQLEYLTSNQSKQYIEDASFGLVTTGTIEIKTKNLTPLSRFAGWGDKNSYDVDIGLATPNSDTNYFPYYYNGWVNPSGSSAVNIANENKLRLDFAPGDQKLYINDVLNRKTSNSVPADRNLPFGLFRISSSGYTGSSTIYYCKVFNELDLLVRYYIPVRRDTDGAIGMYDTTTRAFLQNSGSGAFVVGPDTDLFQNDFIAGPVVDVCANPLSIMGEEMCVETVAPAWPYLTAWSNGQKYYIKLSEDDYPIHSGSSNKIKIKINDVLIYSVYDSSVN